MRSGFSRLCVTGWAVSAGVLRREPRGLHPEPLQPWRGGLLPGRVGAGRVIAPFTTIPLAWLWVHSLLPRGSADLQRIAVCSTPSSGRTPSPLRSPGAAHNTHDKEILLANDGFCTRFAVPAEPPLLSPTRARRGPPASAACATPSPAVRRAFSPSSASRLLQEGTARSAVPSDRVRGVWRCRPCRCAAVMVH